MSTLQFNSRKVKRYLSRFEKSSLPDPTGRALILPSVVGTEVEELRSAGFDPDAIDCIEHNSDAFQKLTTAYPNVFLDDIGDWIARYEGPSYSYIHADLCSHLTPAMTIALQGWKNKITDYARVRISACRGRRGGDQFAWEERVYCELMGRWAKILDIDDSNVDPCDTTSAITALIAANFIFGVKDIREYFDYVQANGDHLPFNHGTHAIASLTRYRHHEPGTKNYMWTTWVDLCPLPQAGNANHVWLRDLLTPLYEELSYFPPVFSMHGAS